MYAIISLQGKQYRVEEGQRLFVDHLAHPADKPFHPTVLFVGGDGKAEFGPKGAEVTARVVEDALGDKIRVAKFRPKTGYRRHTGHRAKLTQIEITAIGLKTERKAAAKAEDAEAEKKPAEAEKKAAAKPKAAAAKKAAPKSTPAKAKKEEA